MRQTLNKQHSDLSSGYFDETEKPGQLFSIDTQMIIRDRYEFAIELAQDKRTLEIGCGAGLGAVDLNQSARSLDLAEYSAENMTYLQDKFGKSAQVSQMDAHEMSYPDSKFDLIIALAMIYYLTFPKFLKEARRVLDEDGTLFFCTSNKDVPGFCPAPYTTKYYSIPELKEILNAKGFAAHFFGAFPALGGPLWKRRLRAIIKDGTKTLVSILPFGRQLWHKIRKTQQGQTFALPESIAELAEPSTLRTPLPDDTSDYQHRVIYVIAKKT